MRSLAMPGLHPRTRHAVGRSRTLMRDLVAAAAVYR
jgi:hypothetical protein